MIDLARWLDATALTAVGAKVSWADAIGAASGVGCVWLTARQHVANWPIGLLNNVMWCWLFFHKRIYADSSLQVFFFVLSCYGWWRWVAKDDRGAVVRVRRTRRREWVALAVILPPVTVAVALFVAHFGDAAPVVDAIVWTLSLAATWQQAEKQLESWWVWIAVDVISVPLYLSRGLYLTAVVYAIFFALCIVGLRDWRRELAAEAAR